MADVSIDQLAAEIYKAIAEYTEDVSEAIEKKVEDVSEEVLKDTVANAPKKTGKYAKGFKITKQGTKRVIWNKKYSRIVHLNEFGHAKVNGGRVPGKPHMRPAYDRFGAKLPDAIKRIIRNGGGI